MSVQHFRIIAATIIVLALVAALGFASHLKAGEAVTLPLATGLGAALPLVVRWLTGGNGNGGTGAGAGSAGVVLVGALTALTGQGCAPANTPREQARSVVLSVAEGVRAGDEACASIARAKGDVTLAEGCAAIVTEARSALLVAEEGIDAWQAVDEGRLACAVKASTRALERLLDAVRRAGGKTPPAVDDALRLAPLLAGACRG